MNKRGLGTGVKTLVGCKWSWQLPEDINFHTFTFPLALPSFTSNILIDINTKGFPISHLIRLNPSLFIWFSYLTLGGNMVLWLYWRADNPKFAGSISTELTVTSWIKMPMPPCSSQWGTLDIVPTVTSAISTPLTSSFPVITVRNIQSHFGLVCKWCDDVFSIFWSFPLAYQLHDFQPEPHESIVNVHF